MTNLSDITVLVDSYAQERYLTGRAEAQAEDQLVIDSANKQIADLKAQVTQLNDQIATLQARIKELEGTVTPPPDPTPVSGKRIGVYSSGNNGTTDALTSSWPKKPNHGTFYMQFNGSIPTVAQNWAKAGRSLSIALMTKIGADSSGVMQYVTWADIAAGKQDTRLTTVIKALEALNVPVDLCLDCEPDAQWNAATGAGGGTVGVKPGQTPEQYVQAANKFGALINANSPSKRVGLSMWFAGFKSASETARFLPDKALLKAVGWDPYKTVTHPASETPTQLFSKFIDSVLTPNGYTTQARHIHETGIQIEAGTNGVTWTSDQQKAFFNGIPAAMDALKITSVTWFRANSGNHKYIPTDPTVDATFRDMVAKTVA